MIVQRPGLSDFGSRVFSQLKRHAASVNAVFGKTTFLFSRRIEVMESG